MEHDAWIKVARAVLEFAPWEDEHRLEEYVDGIEVAKQNWDVFPNPLDAWDVISKAFIDLPEAIALGFLFSRNIPDDESSSSDAQRVHLPLPHWVMHYLCVVAERLFLLTRGCDWRVKPVLSDDLQAFSKAFAHFLDHPTLSVSEAKDLVPSALGLTGDGWNAFDRMRSRTNRDVHVYWYLHALDQGVPPRKARADAMDSMGITDERAFRRVVSEVRRRQKGERPDRRAEPGG